MRGTSRPYYSLIVLALLTTVWAGCANTPTHQPTPANPVPISDFRAVAGKWEGLVRALRQKDWYQVMIHEDGRFEAVSPRGAVGVFRSRGTFTLSDGKLRAESDKGSATYTLYEGDDERILQFDAITSKGIRHFGKLSPAK